MYLFNKKIGKLFITITIFLFLTLFISCSKKKENTENNETEVLSFAHGSTITHPIESGAREFSKIIASELNGKYEVRIFPGGVAYNDNSDTLVEMLESGAIHIGVESVTPFSTAVNSLSAVSIPFLFENWDHIKRFFAQDSEIIKKWKEELAEKNLIVLGFAPRPFRQTINSKKLVTEPDDIKNKKFRVMTSPFHKEIWELLGAKPVPMPSSEIYTSIQLGTVIGEDNSVSNVYDDKTFEVAKYMTLWNYMGDAEMLIMSKVTYDTLSDNEKKVFQEAGKKWVEVYTSGMEKFEEKAYDEMVKAGVEFHIMTEAEKAPFKKLVEPIYAETESEIGKESWNLLMKAVDSAR